MAATVTLADVKAFGGITSANTDALISAILAASIGAIGNYCNRDLVTSVRTEYRDGNNSTKMQVVGYPLTSVQWLTINGNNIPASVNGGPGYAFTMRGRMLYLIGYRFTRGDRNVVINLTGGYGDATNPWPDDLNLAIKTYALTRFKERDRLGVGSKSLAGETVMYDAGSGTSAGSEGVPGAAATILKNYVNSVPESGQ